MVSSYRGHPILYSHLIWNHFTAAFFRYGTLIYLEGYKDTISNKYTKWMVSSYIGHPILHAHLIWNHITAAFSRNETLLNLEGYKDTISNKYKKLMVSSYMGHPILQRFSIPVLAPHRSAHFVCYSYHFRRLFYSIASALRSGHHTIFLHDSSSKRTYSIHSALKCARREFKLYIFTDVYDVTLVRA